MKKFELREVQIGDVRAGDIARSNGKELRVVRVHADGRLIRCEGDGPFAFEWAPDALAALGVTFWREDLPDYPGAVVASRDGHRCAVRACDRGENFAPWLTTDSDPWKTPDSLLEWLGHDWQELTTPPAREWVPVDANQVREGDFVRFEWPDGDAVEGVMAMNGHYIEFGERGIWVMADEPGQWFKREARTM